MTINLQTGSGTPVAATPTQITQIKSDLGIPTDIAAAKASVVNTVTAGTNITITGTAANPIINSSGGGGGGGTWGTITGTLSAQIDLQASLDLKANLASAALTGTPSAPTAAGGTNTTQLANTAFVFAERTNTATITNKTISGTNNTFNNLPASGLTGIVPIANLATGTPTGSKFIRDDGTLQSIAGGGDALVANPLSQFAATTSAQLAGVITNETGSGALVFATSPTLVTPVLGAATAISINGLALTSSTGTVTIANGKTATVNNTLTFTGTDASSVAFGTGGTVAYTAGNLSQFASTSSAQLSTLLSDETGTGSAVFGTGPTISAPTITGIMVSDGATVTTANAMGALVVDVTKALNTKSVAANTTFTFSGTPATSNQWFGLRVKNTDTLAHQLTFPSSYDIGAQGIKTSCPIPASGTLWMVWNYDGSVYNLLGTAPYLNNYTASASPSVGDDADDGYGPGSLWYDATGNALYICESSTVGSAVWTSVASGGAGDMVLANVQTITGAKTFSDAKLILAGVTSGTTVLKSGAIAGSSVITLPIATDTLVGKTTTDTLTNKTIAGASNTLTVRLASDVTGNLPVTNLNAGTSASSATFWRGDGTWSTPAGSGTVTNTGGNLTANSIVLGAGTTDTKVVAGIITDGAAKITLGVAGSSVGSVDFKNATSGTVTLNAVTGALGTVTLLLPAASDTLVGKATTDALTNKSVNGMTITSSTGTFTLTNAKTLAVTNTLTFSGTDSTVMTFPPATASIGYLGLPQNSQSTAYTTVLADAGKHLLHPAADTTARIFTIDSNANVAYPIGTTLSFINQNAGGVITIAITTDTMRLAGAGTTGSRTLAANGIATAIKLTSTEWIINGTGLT